jgi:hypothetical protein
MIGKHFFKMLIGLILMGMIGLAGLFLIEKYSKNEVINNDAFVPE